MRLAAESLSDELTDDAAAVAFSAALSTLKPAPRLRISPSAISVYRDGRWIVVAVRWKGGRSVVVKLSRAWAAVLLQQLTRVLGK
jgi:hypothetical protein